MTIFTKKVGGNVPFVRKEAYSYDGTDYEADIKNGDIVEILDSGTEEDGQYGKQHYFRISTRNGERRIPFNQKTINVLIDEFGDDSEKWVGVSTKVILKKDVIGGRKVIIAYLVVDGWVLDEYGDLIKESQDGGAVAKTDDINIDDIPFD